MRKSNNSNSWKLLIKIMFWLFSSSMAITCPKSADLIILNGDVITCDLQMSRKCAIAIKNGTIIYVGNSKNALSFKSSKTKVIDLEGKTIIPGLHDAHVHFEDGSMELIQLDLRFLNLHEIQEKIKTAVSISPKGALIKGYNFNEVYFPKGLLPTCKDLDIIAPKNPVIIERVDGHSLWVNSVTLSMLRIDKNTETPTGGEIERFPDGSPSGIFKENATNLIKEIKTPKMKIPGLTGKNHLELGMEYASQLGITSVTTSGDLKFIEELKKIKSKGKLKLRFFIWLLAENIEEYKKKAIKYDEGNHWIRIGFLKAFADGTVGSTTAAMFSPYLTKPDYIGFFIHPQNEFQKIVNSAQKNGWQLGIHAIGDRAVNMVLNTIETAQKNIPQKNLRHRIEHAQFIIDDDLARFKELGVIASMQPAHCTTDLLIVEDRVGKKVGHEGYRWQSLEKHGATIAFGSDWPVEPLDPRRGLYSAIERKNIENGKFEAEWNAQEHITLENAIKHFTIDAAFAINSEKYIGSIEKGKKADLTIFEGDLLSLSKKDKRNILNLPIFMTILDGKIVFSNKKPS